MYDVIVIGAGVSGLSAAMYSGRFGMKTLMIGTQPGGLITTTHLVENYPGIPSITGPDMGVAFMEHAQKFGAEIKYETVQKVERRKEKGDFFIVTTASGEYEGKTLVLATGTEHRKLNVPGEKEFANKGVSYCAYCDAAFFKDKVVGVVGGGDSASEEATVLSKYASKVYIFVRSDHLKGEPVLIKQVESNPKIEIMFETELAEVKGDDKVTGVLLKSGSEISLSGLFVAIGHIPKSEIAVQIGVEVNEYGYIKVDREALTNVPGVFAAGDVTDGHFKQAIIGAAEGVYAAYGAYKVESRK